MENGDGKAAGMASALDNAARTMELVASALDRALDGHGDGPDLYRIATAAVDILDATARECRSAAAGM